MRRLARPSFSATAVSVATVLSVGCYTYTPVDPNATLAGQVTRVKLTDAGSFAVAPYIGPYGDSLDGRVTQKDDSGLVLSVVQVTRRSGVEETWRERVGARREQRRGVDRRPEVLALAEQPAGRRHRRDRVGTGGGARCRQCAGQQRSRRRKRLEVAAALRASVDGERRSLERRLERPRHLLSRVDREPLAAHRRHAADGPRDQLQAGAALDVAPAELQHGVR